MKSVTIINGEVFGMEEFTLTDCRNLSLLYEDSCYPMIVEYLEDKLFGCDTKMKKLYALLKGASDFIDHSINMVSVTGTQKKVLISLILNNLKEHISDDYSTTIIHSGYVYTIKPADTLYSDNVDEVYRDAIESIHLEDNESKKIGREDITSVDAIPSDVIRSIDNYITQEVSKCVVFNHPQIESQTINPYTNDIFEFIVPIFNIYDYQSLASIVYGISKQMPDSNYVMTRTPRELDIILSDRENELATQTNSTI
jgi:hypothetical protein